MSTLSTKYIYVHDTKGRPIRKVVGAAGQPEQKLFTVGNNGDFSSLNAAFTYMKNFQNINSETEVRMLDGFYIEESLKFNINNFRNIVLTSEGAENVVSRDYLLKTESHFVDAEQTILPLFAARLRMDETGTPYAGNNNAKNIIGFFVLANSSSLTFASSNHPLLDGKLAGIDGSMAYGVRGALDCSIVLDYQSYIKNVGNLHGTDYTFSGGALIWLTGLSVGLGSRLLVSGADITNGAHSNIAVGNGSNAYIQQADVTGAAGAGYGLEVSAASSVSAAISDFRKDGATEASDILVEETSTFKMERCNGGVNLTPNTVTADGLFIRRDV